MGSDATVLRHPVSSQARKVHTESSRHDLLCKTVEGMGLARFRKDEYHKVVLI